MRCVVPLGIIAGTVLGSVLRTSAGQTAESPADGVRYQGVASCAASGCHHGNGNPGTKGSEYTTWLLRDPHSRAYEVLLGERSRRIEKELKRLPDLASAHPEQSALCLNCHVAPGIAAATRQPRFSPADGVGCESCHGPAEKWLGPHRSWKHSTESERRTAYTESGMAWLSDPAARVRACAACHVGTAAADVNHDLIAAGHPRLTFEYSAYLAHLPPHWDAAAERKRHPDFEARSWAIGQVAVARAALGLLVARAKPGKPWPEFAEYNCASCHRDLKVTPQTGPEREQGEAKSVPSRLGLLPFGTWDFAALPQALALRPAEENAVCQTALNALRNEMDKPTPDAAAVAKEAQALGGLLDRWLAASGSARYDNAPLLRQGLAALADEDGPRPADRDARLQRYYGMTALYRTLLSLGVEQRDPLTQATIDRLKKQLRSAEPMK